MCSPCSTPLSTPPSLTLLTAPITCASASAASVSRRLVVASFGKRYSRSAGSSTPLRRERRRLSLSLSFSPAFHFASLCDLHLHPSLSPSPAMDGNKDESERCLRLVNELLATRNFPKAYRFAQKAHQLYPTEKTLGKCAFITCNVVIRRH